MTLTETAIFYHSDKIQRHGYLPLYEKLLANRDVKNLLEVGIGYAGMMKPFVDKFVPQSSLRIWRDYFTNATIYGIDNHPECMIASEERIVTLLCDQHDTEELTAFAKMYGPFSVVLDDGDHTVASQIATFHALWPHVEKGGVYICEDAQDANKIATEMNGNIFFGGKCHDDYLVWRENR